MASKILPEFLFIFPLKFQQELLTIYLQRLLQDFLNFYRISEIYLQKFFDGVFQKFFAEIASKILYFFGNSFKGPSNNFSRYSSKGSCRNFYYIFLEIARSFPPHSWAKAIYEVISKGMYG